MKIAIATTKGGLDDEVSPFFGRCPVFTLVDAEGTEIKNADVIQNESASATGGAGIQAAQSIAEMKVEAMLAGNFGPNAVRILSSAGIKMVQAQGNVKEAVMKYLSGDLKPVSDSTVEGHFGMGAGMDQGQEGGMGQVVGQAMGRDQEQERGQTEHNLKIAVPTDGERGMDESVGEHFGRVTHYTIYDTESKEFKAILNTSHHMGGEGYPPELLADNRVNILLCAGLGWRAIDMFKENGIKVYVGAHGTVRDALLQWEKEELQEASEGSACSRHEFRSESHDEGQCGRKH